jgi:hypothetical protein
MKKFKLALCQTNLYFISMQGIMTPQDNLSLFYTDILNTMKGVMSAHISVRKNARVMISRNLDVEGGIVNGT